MELRDERGAVRPQPRPHTLICGTRPGLTSTMRSKLPDAVSREHPCRVIVIVEPDQFR